MPNSTYPPRQSAANATISMVRQFLAAERLAFVNDNGGDENLDPAARPWVDGFDKHIACLDTLLASWRAA